MLVIAPLPMAMEVVAVVRATLPMLIVSPPVDRPIVVVQPAVEVSPILTLHTPRLAIAKALVHWRADVPVL